MKHSPMMQDLPSMAIRRPVLIVVLNLLIIIAGLAAIAGISGLVAACSVNLVTSGVSKVACTATASDPRSCARNKALRGNPLGSMPKHAAIPVPAVLI